MRRPRSYFSGLRWVWLGMGVVALGCYGVSWWAAGRQMAMAEGELRARGLPSSVEELAPAAGVPRGQDVYKAAFAALNPRVDSPRSSNYTFGGRYLPYPLRWWAMANLSAQTHCGVFSAMVDAAKSPGATWQAPGVTGMARIYRGLNDARQLANLSADEALRRHFLGDEAGYLELLEAMLALGESLTTEPTIVQYLVGVGIRQVALSDVPLVASGLRVGSSPGAEPERIRALVGRLLMDDRADFEWSVVGDGFWMDEHYVEAWGGAGPLSPLRVSLVAGSLRNGAAWIGEARAGLAASEGKYGPKIHNARADLGFDRLDVVDRRQRLGRIVAATALATALYRSDHGGAWPETLESLVPVYLPEVPADPFGVDGEAIVLRHMEGGMRPVLISRGQVMGPLSVTDADLSVDPVYEMWRAFNARAPQAVVIDLRRYSVVDGWIRRWRGRPGS